jgi:hypothetical protein
MDCEWLILADWAQTVGNKLYLQGGGWDQLSVNGTLPTRQHVGVAAAFSVPWDETNIKHSVELDVLTADGAPAAQMKAMLEAGRPAGVPPGQSQRVQLAVNMFLEIKRFGTYEIVARVGGQDARRIHFNVGPGPQYRALQAS